MEPVDQDKNSVQNSMDPKDLWVSFTFWIDFETVQVSAFYSIRLGPAPLTIERALIRGVLVTNLGRTSIFGEYSLKHKDFQKLLKLKKIKHNREAVA